MNQVLLAGVFDSIMEFVTEAIDSHGISTARCVGPEDLAIGDYVAVTHFAGEYPSFLWYGDNYGVDPHVPIKVWWTGARDEKSPLKIRAICLPFLLAKTYDRRCMQLDVRLVQIVRLAPSFARQVRKGLRKQDKEKRGSNGTGSIFRS